MKAKRFRYEQRYDGEWFPVTWPMRLACCDCGLVHDFKLRRNTKTGAFQISAKRIPPATGGKRAALKRAKKGVFR